MLSSPARFHDYIFSLDPNAGVAGEFSYFVDGVILATLPIADFAGTGEDLFGFTPFQGGGGGNTEEFYVHNLSLFSGPAGSPPTDFEWTVDSAGDWTNSGNWSAGSRPANQYQSYGNVGGRDQRKSYRVQRLGRHLEGHHIR